MRFTRASPDTAAPVRARGRLVVVVLPALALLVLIVTYWNMVGPACAQPCSKSRTGTAGPLSLTLTLNLNSMRLDRPCCPSFRIASFNPWSISVLSRSDNSQCPFTCALPRKATRRRVRTASVARDAVVAGSQPFGWMLLQNRTCHRLSTLFDEILRCRGTFRLKCLDVQACLAS
jgi:hypothetical protein